MLTQNQLQIAYEVLFDDAAAQASILERPMLQMFRTRVMAALPTLLVEVNGRLGTSEKESAALEPISAAMAMRGCLLEAIDKLDTEDSAEEAELYKSSIAAVTRWDNAQAKGKQ